MTPPELKDGWYFVYPDGEMEYLSFWRLIARLRYGSFMRICPDREFTKKSRLVYVKKGVIQ